MSMYSEKKRKGLYIIQTQRVYHKRESSGKQTIHTLEILY